MAPTAVSADGRWWWDGQRWVAAESADGLWHWDGTEWWASVPMDHEDPVQLSSALDLMADERYLEAGTVLARLRRKWPAPEELAPVVDEAHSMLQRLDGIEARLSALEAQLGQGGGSVLGWLSGAVGERRQLRAERDRLREKLRGALIEVGEGAKQPTTKETDEILTIARSLRGRAIAVSSAIAAVMAAKHDHDDQLAAAHAEVESAEQVRADAIRQAERELEGAAAVQQEAIELARRQLAAVSMGEAGERVASFRQLQLSQHWIETPDGKGPAEGARAFLDTAPALWRAHQPLLSRMLEVDATEARVFHEAESSGSGELFLLVLTDLASSIVHCPPDQVDAARHFVVEVATVSERLRAVRTKRDASLAALRAELEARLSDRSAVARAQARLAAAKGDKGLLRALDVARQRVEEIRADDSEVRRAQETLHHLIDDIAKPPEPLLAVPGAEERSQGSRGDRDDASRAASS